MNTATNNPIAYQIMWNRLISIVEEQAQVLIRTAFSSSVREAGDLSAGVYDVTGAMLAQAVTGTPGHVNSMAHAVTHCLRNIGAENMNEGDVYITNDPWEGTGHLLDITVITPVFYQNERVGFFACTAHVVDIGGVGFSADASSVHEEGLYIPMLKFISKGVADQTFIKIVRANTRVPTQLVGDMFALAACNDAATQRLTAMMDEYGISRLTELASFILEKSYHATLAKIAALPPASSEGEMTIDGFARPITLKVKLQITPQAIYCDFSGSSPADSKGINVPLVYTQAYTCYALKCAIAPDIPNNAASLKPFKTTAPKNCIVNAHHPLPVTLRHVIGHMIPDTIYNALDKILPHTVPAEGAGALCNFQLSLRPRTDQPAPPHAKRAEVLTFNSGGGGARPTQDGMNTTAFPSGVMTMPVEATEHTGPVVIWQKELRPNSGGAGKYQGGLGQCMTVGALDGHEFYISPMLDRVKFPARGRHGGQSGAPTTIALCDGTVLRGKGWQFVGHGKQVHMAFAGGAGHGDPAARDAAAVAHDIAQGYITPDFARQHYKK